MWRKRKRIFVMKRDCRIPCSWPKACWNAFSGAEEHGTVYTPPSRLGEKLACRICELLDNVSVPTYWNFFRVRVFTREVPAGLEPNKGCFSPHMVLRTAIPLLFWPGFLQVEGVWEAPGDNQGYGLPGKDVARPQARSWGWLQEPAPASCPRILLPQLSSEFFI